MTFKVNISLDNAGENRLIRCTKGNDVYFVSPDESNFTGIKIKLNGNKLAVKGSLHKYYSLLTTGKLENCGRFTMSEAKTAIAYLFGRIGANLENAVINSYEIGLNLTTAEPPLDYINAIELAGHGTKRRRKLYEDVRFELNRQKTSTRKRNIKVIFKIYDKGFEMADRKRQDKTDTPKILRLETMYKRVNDNAVDFFEASNLQKIASQFFEDWHAAVFKTDKADFVVIAPQGTKTSIIDKARRIMTLGRDEFLKDAERKRRANEITPKQYRNLKVFLNNWDNIKSRFRFAPPPLETEFKNKLQTEYLNVKY